MKRIKVVGHEEFAATSIR